MRVGIGRRWSRDVRVAAVTTTIGLALTLIQAPPERTQKACSLSGDKIDVSFYYPDLTKKIYDAGSFVVPSSDIDPRGLRYASIDLADHSITVHYKSSQMFNKGRFHGYVLTDLDRKNISSVTVDSTTTVSGFTASRLSVMNDSVSLNLEGLSYTPGEQIQLDIGFSCERPLISGLPPAPTS